MSALRVVKAHLVAAATVLVELALIAVREIEYFSIFSLSSHFERKLRLVLKAGAVNDDAAAAAAADAAVAGTVVAETVGDGVVASHLKKKVVTNRRLLTAHFGFLLRLVHLA